MPPCAAVSPRVSACLLTYNHVNVVSDAIESVLKQQFEDFELIISDDCSTDATWDVVRAYEQRDARVRAIQTPRNLGMPGNGNFAIGHARAPYIALLHHDDIYTPELFTRWVEVMERHPDVGFVSNAFGSIDQNDFSHPFAERNDGKQILEELMFSQWGCPFRGTGFIRRTAWDAVGGLRERYGMVADVDLWMRLASRYAIGYVNAPVVIVRQDRPSYYPAEYSKFSWYLNRLIYEIHAANIAEYYGTESLDGLRHWLQFRARVSVDVARWLAYGVVKQRWDLVRSSNEVATPYEFAAVRVARRGLIKLTESLQ